MTIDSVRALRRARPARLLGVGALAAAGLTLFTLHTLTGLGGRPSTFFDVVLYDGLELGAGLALAFRAVRERCERGAWALLAAAVVCEAIGDLLFSVAYGGDPPYPSVADGFYLAYYPLAYLGFLALLRSRVGRVGRSVWLDGAMAALAAAALAAAVLVEAVAGSTSGSTAAVAVNLAYPLGDLLLLSLVVVACVLVRGRGLLAWSPLAAALVVQIVADCVFLLQAARGNYLEGTVLDVSWPLSALLVAVAAYLPRAVRGIDMTARPLFVVPAACTATGIGILVADHVTHQNVLAFVLAIACLVAVLVRVWLTFREHGALLAASRSEAAADPLTGLANRRRLLTDLDALLAEDGNADEYLLMIFDLDGFKRYNDTFGHLAGDALLGRIAGRLADVAATTGGNAYRLGGDEFCLIAAREGRDPSGLVERACAALSERSDRFEIGASAGCAIVPVEASTSTEALRLADQRLYAAKHGFHLRSGRAWAPLVQALNEHEPDDHNERVADLSYRLGRELGLEERALNELSLAGKLHDIGKLAVPDAILTKPGPLDENELLLVRAHPLIGQRILSASPELASVGALVRSHHERVDGGGYPDGLAGQEIPLASRILAVCDTYDALVSDRPYRRARQSDEALAELRRVAGTQLDAALVERFCRVLEADERAAA